MKKMNLYDFIGLKSLLRVIFGGGSFLAFTLVEVLITLGIIGVVSALTIPSLITNYQKRVYVNKLKQNYSLIQQGLRLYMAEEGLDDISSPDLDWKQSKEALGNLFKKYFKVSQDCHSRYAPCFYEITSFYSDGKIYRTPNRTYTCNLVVTLVNGASICADAYDSPAVEDDGESSHGPADGSGEVMSIEIDVNGRSGPNIGGQDLFWFSIDEKGNIFDPYYSKSGYNYMNNSVKGALGQIMKDNWEIKYF